MQSSNIQTSQTGLGSRLLSQEAYSANVHLLLLAYCFVAALSIALSQILLAAALLYSLLFFLNSGTEARKVLLSSPISAPIAYWVLACIISAVCGVDPMHSLPEWAKSSVYVLLPFVILQSQDWTSPEAQRLALARLKIYLLAFCSGQAAAALHTLGSASLQLELWPRIPGAVTESGQLALLIPCLIALTRGADGHHSRARNLETAALVLLLGVLLLVAWPEAAGGASHARTLQLWACAGAIALCLAVWRISRRDFSDNQLRLLISLYACLLLAAFVINLKRGPWSGVLIALLFLGIVSSRRLLVRTVIFAGLVMLTLYPARHRLTSFADDFTISGGRKMMWTLGAELAQRFPLGVGPANASYMRRLDETLPPLHRHMHNNLLNVAVEVGWIGLASYVWWIFTAIALGFRVFRRTGSKSLIGFQAICLSAALISWQVAGLVEYNFGDGEVRLIAFFLMGLLLVLHRISVLEASHEDDKAAAAPQTPAS